MRLKPKTKQRRGGNMERSAILLLLGIAWSWIFVTFGMVFYHGYYKKKQLPKQKKVQQPQFLPGVVRPPLYPQADVPDPKKLPEAPPSSSLNPHESPLLIFTCNRHEYLQQTLDDVFQYLPRDCRIGCPIVVSQDGNNPQVRQVITEYQDKFQAIGIPLVRIEHTSALRGGKNAYQALAVHYGWALQQVFDGRATVDNVVPQRVIILEEDIHVAVDFFNYFAALAPLLDRDSSLLAVSAFNDNGYQDRVQDATRVLRSDFFPGLGWMMTRRLWVNELASKWPQGYWDDWLRDPAQRQGRHILRPEISRTFHFGTQGGASHNQFGGKLNSVLLDQTPVEWNQQDLSYLEATQYDAAYWRLLQAARRVDSLDQALELSKEESVRLEYNDFAHFQSLAKHLKLMDDEKAGIPRTAYKGVVETRPHGKHILFLTPSMKELQESFKEAMR